MAVSRVASAYFALVLALVNDVLRPTFGFTTAPVSASRIGRFALRSTSEASQQAIDDGASSNELDNATGKPLWAKCINTVTSRTMPLNEAVSQAANVSLTEAVDLIEIGAVWGQNGRHIGRGPLGSVLHHGIIGGGRGCLHGRRKW